MYVEKTKDFTPTPAGVHKAVCTRFVDLGTHEDNGPYGYKVRREIMISWEIPGCRVMVDGEDKPVIHNQYYTWSMADKARLRNDLESWRNAAFTEKDLAGPPDGFNTRKLIGVGCMLHIMHNENGKAKLKSIMPLPKAEWPQPENEPLYFQMQEPPLDTDAFGRLSDYHQGKIKMSPEWEKLTGRSRGNENDGRDDNGGFHDDEIPF